MKIQNQFIKKACGKIVKHAPEIAVGAGIIGNGIAMYLMFRASKKHAEIMDDIHEELDEVRESKPEEGAESAEIKAYGKNLGAAYVHAAGKLIKNYAAPALIFIASNGIILGGFGIVNSRMSACAAAAAVSQKEVARIRKNLRDRFGEETERDIVYGIRDTEEEVPALDKNGEQKIDKEGNPKFRKIHRRSLEEELDGYSTYARIFGKDHTDQAEINYENSNYNNVDYNVNYVKSSLAALALKASYSPVPFVTFAEIYKVLGLSCDGNLSCMVTGFPVVNGKTSEIHYDIVSYDELGNFIIDFYDYTVANDFI